MTSIDSAPPELLYRILDLAGGEDRGRYNGTGQLNAFYAKLSLVSYRWSLEARVLLWKDDMLSKDHRARLFFSSPAWGIYQTQSLCVEGPVYSGAGVRGATLRTILPRIQGLRSIFIRGYAGRAVQDVDELQFEDFTTPNLCSKIFCYHKLSHFWLTSSLDVTFITLYTVFIRHTTSTFPVASFALRDLSFLVFTFSSPDFYTFFSSRVLTSSSFFTSVLGEDHLPGPADPEPYLAFFRQIAPQLRVLRLEGVILPRIIPLFYLCKELLELSIACSGDHLVNRKN